MSYRRHHQVFWWHFTPYKSAKPKRFAIKLVYTKAIILSWVLIVAIGFGRLYTNIIRALPDVDSVEDIVFSESTVITDRSGKELYKLFQENREYVRLEDISPNMINAIIAVEDQSFWTNPGIDLGGIVRGMVWVVIGDSSRGWGSTITQQLLKNILLDTSENRYKRKLKEWILAGKLNTSIKTELKKEYKQLSDEDLQQKMKEKILEMYLNYIFLWQNAYGVQAASRTYFNTSSDKLTPLQSAILASLPKSPTKLNPYKNKNLLMGQIVIRQWDQSINPPDGLVDKIIERIELNLKNINFDKKWAGSFVKVIVWLTDFSITLDSQTYQVSYEPGRKDFSLMNMFDEGYIDQVVLKKAFVEWLNYKFEEGKVSIKAPHFIHWIQELLEQQYDNDMLTKGGLIVKTSLDEQAQERAEAAIAKNYRSVEEHGANNQAMVYINSTNGDVLAYVGSADYFNEEIDGKVDMVRALRQPWSSIKPLIYALSFEKLPLTLDTPIFDLPLQIAWDRPNNVDGEFMWLMPMRKALAFSRNIPTIKLFLSVGGEKVVKPFLKALWLKGLSEWISYGYPLAIGAWEVQILELANAYMHLSAWGEPAVINPILEIRTSDGSIVYQKQSEKQRRVIPAGITSLIRSILSDRSNSPPWWISFLSVPGITNAIKSWTSDVKVKQPDWSTKTLPRDGWIATYTPSRVALFWAWNTNGAPMGQKAFGITLNSAVWKDFFSKLKDNGLLPKETYPLAEIKTLTVDKMTGLGAWDDVPAPLRVDTKGYVYNLPATEPRKGKIIKYDTMCNGKRMPSVPDSETAEGYVIPAYSIMPDNRDIDKIQEWIKAETGFFLEEPETMCEWRVAEEDSSIKIDILKPEAGGSITKNFEVRYNVAWQRPLKHVRIYVNDIVVAEQEYKNGQTSLTDIKAIVWYAGIQPGDQLITIEAVDQDGYYNKQSIPVTLWLGDINPPFILEDRIKVEKQADGKLKIYLLFSDAESVVKWWSIFVDGAETTFKDNLVSFVIVPGQKITYSVEDIYGNKKTDELILKLGN